jgi:leucyl/phenylalanyl-tRNA---protein transferase
MPVYQLPKDIVFPYPEEADPDGLLAAGGDLSLKRLLLAYSKGIFPWYSTGNPILWWSPDPRLVLDVNSIKISKSLKRVIKNNSFNFSMDTSFDLIINKCSTTKRNHQDETWIVDDMIKAYIQLHKAGFAHSVEAWADGKLAGGLYGVSLGKAFFGESMFADKSDASKAALVCLANTLKCWGFDFIDCQVTTGHLVRMGAREISRADFLKRLKTAIHHKTRQGKWSLPENTNK